MNNRENWIKIDRKVLYDEEFNNIESLLSLLLRKPKNSLNRYNFFIDIDLKNIENCGNFSSLSKSLQEIIIEQYKASVISGKNKAFKYLIINKETYSSSEFNVEQALRFFEMPVIIILENGRNDAYFLKAIFKFFDIPYKSKNRFIEFYNNGWIRIENAGGWTNIKNSIISLSNSLQAFCSDAGRPTYDFIRCVVLMDSDKEFSTDEKTEKIDLKVELEELGIQTHILDKRAMENYMPDEVIDNESNRLNLPHFKQWYKVYKFLTKEQKDFLNFPKGFSKNAGGIPKPRNEQKLEISNLYSIATISDTNYSILDSGIKYPNFKEDFSQKFESALVYKENMLFREGGTVEENEFNDIINKLNKIL